MIRPLRISLLLTLFFVLTQFAAAAADPQLERSECFFCWLNRYASSGTANTPQFERLRSLAGNWAGTDQDGKGIKVSYAVLSNGSAVLEKLTSPEGGTMVTMYHRDGDRILATHYCSAGNQPRMTAVPTPAVNDMTFIFVDGTNFTNSSNGGHMQGLTLQFKDKSHLTQHWTFRHNNGHEQVEIVNLHRTPGVAK